LDDRPTSQNSRRTFLAHQNFVLRGQVQIRFATRVRDPPREAAWAEMNAAGVQRIDDLG
jgi:hypothetical protein